MCFESKVKQQSKVISEMTEFKKTTTQLSPKHIHESFFELIKSEIFKKSHQNAANFQKHILLRNLMQSAIAQNAANFLLKTGHP